MRRTPEITLPLRINPADGTLPEQVAAQLRDLISADVLAPGDPIPSSRALAQHLGVSRGSVVAAYDQLLAEGYVSAAAGQGTVVNPQLRRVHPPAPLPKPRRSEPAPAALLDLRPGRPWTGDLVGPQWKAAWRRAANAPADAQPPGLGLPELRRAWSDHLRRMRALVRDPDSIAVTGGGRDGLALILLALQRPGFRVGVEDPGYPSLRRVPARYGAGVVPLPVDEHGLITNRLPAQGEAPELLLVTPSHQYPLGGSLPMDRRQELLEWAHDHRVVIVEDDYDSELRYTSSPLPALAALDDPVDGRVVLLSTLSKTITPALATGFLALPQWLVPAVAAIRSDLGQPQGLVSQRAIAEFLQVGALRIHTQRMRQRYRRRRAEVVSALRDRPGLAVYPMDGGLHAVVETERDEAEVVSELAARGVVVSPLSQYWSQAGSRRGIVFGFGAVTAAELATGLHQIAEVASSPALPTATPRKAD
ncbi:MAG TPA: PLP-dependent aminotransferase family protein [Propionicimonas sp.]|nr:PLP-dependent aminotransferase family protein [Propionicimonas sp.]